MNIWTTLAARYGLDRGVVKNIGYMLMYRHGWAWRNYIARRFDVPRNTVDKIAEDLLTHAKR